MSLRAVKFIVAFALFLSGGYSIGQTPANEFDLLNKKADSLYNARDFVQSAQNYELAIQKFPAKANANTYYNAGCSWSLAGKKDMAFENLFKAANDYGYSNYSHINQDKDLVNLHKDKRWKKFSSQVENNYRKKYNITLQNELDKIFADDQQCRNERDTVLARYGMNSKEYRDVIAKIERVDSLNDRKISLILESYGWPGPYSADGEKIEPIKSFYLYTILQHSSLETQVKYLPLLKDAVKKGNARAKDFGYVQDRILQRQGKRQIYGTQLSVDKDNRPFIWPIEDVDNLDKRRKELGMQPMKADLTNLFNMDWNLEEYKIQLKGLEEYVKIKD